MDLIFYFALTEKASRFPRPIYKKYIDVGVIPRVGEHITESLKNEPHEVVDVDYDYYRRVCFVYLKPEDLQCSFKEYFEIARMHGWVERLSDIDYM